MSKSSWAVVHLCVVAAFALLSGCDGGASAVAVREVHPEPARTGGEEGMADSRTTDYSAPDRSQAGERPDPRDQPVPKLDGQPIWTANSRRTAEENVARQFERNGEDFSARTVEDYARKAHQFVSNPPSTAETLNRENGDILIYDPRSNVFAVASSQGVPRTMFKPRDGASYWAEQKERQAGKHASSGSDAQHGSNREG